MDPDQVRQDIRPDLGQNRLVSLLFLAPRMDSLGPNQNFLNFSSDLGPNL